MLLYDFWTILLVSTKSAHQEDRIHVVTCCIALVTCSQNRQKPAIQMASPNGRQSRHVVLCCATGQEHGGVGASSVRGRQRGCLITVEGGQLGGVGGEEAGGDAAPVAAADDGHPVLACVPILHLRRPERNADQLAARSSNSNTGTKNKSGNSEKREDRPRATSHSSSEYIQNRGGRTKREFLIRNGEEC